MAVTPWIADQRLKQFEDAVSMMHKLVSNLMAADASFAGRFIKTVHQR